MANLKFIKKSTQPTAEAGVIWFNPSAKSLYLCEDGSTFKNYTGVRNASYANKVLTIINESGSELKLDFSDVPSAEGVSSLLAAIRTDVNKNTSDIATLTSDLSVANGLIAANSQAILDEADRADEAEKKIAQDLAAEIENRGIAEQAITAAATTLKGRVDGHDTKIADLETSVGTDDAKGLRKKVKDLEGTVGSGTKGLVGTTADHETRIDALEANVGASGNIGSRLAAVETLAGQNKAAIALNDSDIADHETRITAVENAVKDGGSLEVRVDNIENLIAASGDSDNVINKVSEVITWFEGVSEGKGGATLLSDVATLKNETVPGVKSTADTAFANANQAQSDIDALEEAVGSGFSKTSTVASQLAAVKSTANAALPSDTFELFKGTNTQNIADAKAAGTAAQSTADQALADAATADGKAVAAQGRANDAYTLADGKVSSVTASGAGYLSLSATTGKTPAISGSLTVQAMSSATSSKKGLAEAYDVKSYVDNKVSTSIAGAMVWSEWA